MPGERDFPAAAYFVSTLRYWLPTFQVGPQFGPVAMTVKGPKWAGSEGMDGAATVAPAWRQTGREDAVVLGTWMNWMLNKNEMSYEQRRFSGYDKGRPC